MTREGHERAERLIRRQRLAETLFTQTFQMHEAEVEAEACYFEHILSPAVTDSICAFLGHPPACPHGKAIPRGPCCAAASLVSPARS
jgi:DtxR family Mn-dependent transcriptional regulator